MVPSIQPTGSPSSTPSLQPTSAPTTQPSRQPTGQPTVTPTSNPSIQPEIQSCIVTTVDMGVDMALDNETSDSYAAVLYALSMSAGLNPEDITIATNDDDESLCGVDISDTGVSRLHRLHRHKSKMELTRSTSQKKRSLLTYQELLSFQENSLEKPYHDESLVINSDIDEIEGQRKLFIQKSSYSHLLDDGFTLPPAGSNSETQNNDGLPFIVLPLSEDASSPTPQPTQNTTAPTVEPTIAPTAEPTPGPTPGPTPDPTVKPTPTPTTASPSAGPTPNPTVVAGAPSANPTPHPISNPTLKPSASPTLAPVVANPTAAPVADPAPVPNPAPAPIPQPASVPSPPSNTALSFSVIGQQTTAEEADGAEDALENSISNAFEGGDFANILIDTAVQNNISSLASADAISAVSAARSVVSVVGEPVKINAPTSFPTSSLPTMNTPTAFPTGTFYPTATQPPTSTPTRSPYLYEEILNDPILLSGAISSVIFVILLGAYIYRKRHAIRKVAIESLEDMELIERKKEIDMKLNVIKQKKQSKISRFLEIQQEHEKRVEEKTKEQKSGHIDNKIHHAQSKPKTKVVKVRDLAKAQGKEVFKSKPVPKGKKGKHKVFATIGENDSCNSAGESEDEISTKFDPREMRRRSFANPNTQRSNGSERSIHPMEFVEETKEDILDEIIEDRITMNTGRSVQSTNSDVVKRMMSTQPLPPSTPPSPPKLKFKNAAFVYLKPHANKPSVRMAVSKLLIEKGFKIAEKGPVWSDTIISNSLFDKQYLSIAKRSMLQKPALMVLSSSAALKFKEKFGLHWHETIANGNIFNALDATEKLEIDFVTLSKLWRKAYSDDRMLRLAKGFHVAYITNEDQDKDKGIYCVNGFYQSMRKSYLQPDSSIYYMVVEWDEDGNADAMSWKTFRSDIIGCSDPSRAPSASVRKLIYQNWKKYGLKCAPDIEANGIHASGSAFEAAIQISNWLSKPVFDEPLFQKFMEANVPHPTSREWMSNPQIKGKSAFDHFEGLGFTECIDKAKELYSYTNKTSRSVSLASRTAQSNIKKSGTLVGSRSVSPTSSVSSASPSSGPRPPPPRPKPPTGPPSSSSMLALGTPLSPSKSSSVAKSLSFGDKGDIIDEKEISPGPPERPTSLYENYLSGISRFFAPKPKKTVLTVDTNFDATYSKSMVMTSTPSGHLDAAIEPHDKPTEFITDTREVNKKLDYKKDDSLSNAAEDISAPRKYHDDAVLNDHHSEGKANQSPLTAFGSPLSSPSKKLQADVSVSRFPNIDADDEYTDREMLEGNEKESVLAKIGESPPSSLFTSEFIQTTEGGEKEIKSDADELKTVNAPNVEPEKKLTAAEKRTLREAKEVEEENMLLEKLAAEKERKRLITEAEARKEQEAIAGRISLRERLAAAANITSDEAGVEKGEEKEEKDKQLLQVMKEQQHLEERVKEKNAIAAKEIMSKMQQGGNSKGDDGDPQVLVDSVKAETEFEKRVRLLKEAAMAKKLAEISAYSSSTEEVTSVVDVKPHDNTIIAKSEVSSAKNVQTIDDTLTIDTSPGVVSSFESTTRSPAHVSQPLSGLANNSAKAISSSDAENPLDRGTDDGISRSFGSDPGLGLQLPVFAGMSATNDDDSSVTSIGTAITATSAVQHHGTVRIKYKKEKKIKSTTVMEL